MASGRELDIGERWFRGLLAPLDIVPGVGAAKKFATTGRVTSKVADFSKIGLKTADLAKVRQSIGNTIQTARTKGLERISQLKEAGKATAIAAGKKIEKSVIDAGKVIDKGITAGKQAKSNLSPQHVTPEGVLMRESVENTRAAENIFRGQMENVKGVFGSGKNADSTLLRSSEVGNKAVATANDIKDITKLTVNDIPTAKSGNFNIFFNSLTTRELDELWKNKKLRKKIERQLRAPGGLHEWHLVSRAPQFKYWNTSADEIKDLRTAISDVKFVNPNGVHGGLGSTKAHNELLAIIDTSTDYSMFVRRLNNWANYRLEGGVSSLPEGLIFK